MGRRLFGGAGIALALALLIAAPSASMAATSDEAFAEIGNRGSAAGQLNESTAIATNPVDGHVFVIDSGNARIDEFTPWGNFVKAFGWDVAPGAVNEQQEVTVKATAGEFKLSFAGSTTSDLEWNAPPSGPGSVEAALNALSSVSSGGNVSVEEGVGDSSSTRYVVSFSGGSLAGVNVGQISAAEGTIPLSGGTPASSATVATRADGTPGGPGLESCTLESGCQAGSKGPGVGQIEESSPGLAVDAAGNIYVRSAYELDRRVQKFDPAGRFLLTLGGEVNETKSNEAGTTEAERNLCTAAQIEAGNVCAAGTFGAGQGQFSSGRGIAVNATGEVFVADLERIQTFRPDGSFKAQLPVPGKEVKQVQVDAATGGFVATFAGEPDAHTLSPAGVELCSLPVSEPEFLASGSNGHIYVGSEVESSGSGKILEFDGTCPVGSPTSETVITQKGDTSISANGIATNSAGDLLIARNGVGISFISVNGPPPLGLEPRPKVSPSITAQFALFADEHSAVVRAQINPNFWEDTAYFVEYGIEKCSGGGCTLKQPPTPSQLGAGIVRKPLPTADVELPGLSPGTTYYYRFVAESSGGGPVRGVGGKVGTNGAEGSFRTQAPATVEPTCPTNEAFRVGASAALPDCRAYEMVSPIDKEHGDVLTLANETGVPNGLNQAALNGESIAYSSYRAFAGSKAAIYVSEYLASRSSEGWISESLAPARGGEGVFGDSAKIQSNFKAFSPDLCQTWLINDAEPLLAPGAIAKFPNLYRRDNCAAVASSEAMTTEKVTEPLPQIFNKDQLPELKGFSADGKTAIFLLQNKPGAEEGERIYQMYRSSGGKMDLVCILPDGTPLEESCSSGGGTEQTYTDRGGVVSNAISDDGSRIYWTSGTYGLLGETAGKIYLRIDGSETKEISGTVTTSEAQFLGASADGSSALFKGGPSLAPGPLYRYSLDSESSVEIAGQVIGIAGATDDLSYVYFVSEETIGGKGVTGEANLYLLHDGERTFVATLSAGDVRRPTFQNDNGAYSDVANQPFFHVAKTTPNGRNFIFISGNPLTGFDNADAASGEPDEEVFRYDADANQINCISCSPAGARPQGRNLVVPGEARQWAAAMIPAGQTQLYTPRAQSDDGDRVFFTSYTDLLPRDRNGLADVYEWEAVNTERCTAASPAFSAFNSGCVYLISTGDSTADSVFVDSSPDGRDAFFSTEESILRQDPGEIDIYDARVGGGFEQPSEVKSCDFTTLPCQAAAPAPAYRAPSPPASEGNPTVRCPRGKHKVTKKARPHCVRRKKHPGKRHSEKKKAHQTRRAGK